LFVYYHIDLKRWQIKPFVKPSIITLTWHSIQNTIYLTYNIHYPWLLSLSSYRRITADTSFWPKMRLTIGQSFYNSLPNRLIMRIVTGNYFIRGNTIISIDLCTKLLWSESTYFKVSRTFRLDVVVSNTNKLILYTSTGHSCRYDQSGQYGCKQNLGSTCINLCLIYFQRVDILY